MWTNFVECCLIVSSESTAGFFDSAMITEIVDKTKLGRLSEFCYLTFFIIIK